MNEAHRAVDQALDDAVELMTGSGLAQHLQELIHDVWSTNVSRYEPEDLGDTAKSLGIQCSENIRERAKRRFHGDPDLPAEELWDVDGLVLSSPRDALMMHLYDLRVAIMKVPMQHGRVPQWDRFRDWEYESQVRNDFAAENTRVLNGYTFPPRGQLELPWTVEPVRGKVRNFMVLWAGERDVPATSGWLAVPTNGEVAFAAWRQLWRDDADAVPQGPRRTTPRTPGFDEQPVAEPKIALKPRPDKPAAGGGAGTGGGQS